MVTTVEVLALILGSNAFIEILKYAFNRRASKAAAGKVEKESTSLSLENEIKTSEFYKKEWHELVERYENIEKQLDDKIKEYMDCRGEITILQRKYEELLRQVTLLKTQLGG